MSSQRSPVTESGLVVPHARGSGAPSVGRASQEARQRGDRKVGTDDLVLDLLEELSIDGVLGVRLQDARDALDALDWEALGALDTGTDASPVPVPAVQVAHGQG